MLAVGLAVQITSRSGTPSQSPVPRGASSLLQVIVLRKRTECFSAIFISPSKVKAVPSASRSGRVTWAFDAGSASTSSRQLSRVNPAVLSFSGGSL